MRWRRAWPAIESARLAQQHVHRAGSAMAWLGRAEGQHAIPAAQLAIDQILQHRPVAIRAQTLAVHDAHTAPVFGLRLAQEVPQCGAGLGRGHAMQVDFGPRAELAPAQLAKRFLRQAGASKVQCFAGLDIGSGRRLGQALGGLGVFRCRARDCLWGRPCRPPAPRDRIGRTSPTCSRNSSPSSCVRSLSLSLPILTTASRRGRGTGKLPVP